MKRLSKILRNTPLLFAAGAVIVLLASTLYWALSSARLQQGNADQLVDGFLFASRATFRAGIFPASHTQLLMWPLFALLHVFRYASGAYLTLTVLVTLATVGLLALVFYRIERRPLVFGLLCLLLASALVLVPAQVFSGVTAPLNLALLTGRNLEYALYIGTLLLFIRAKRFRSWQWLASIALLTLLLASDQLFTPFSLGGSLLLLTLAYIWRHTQLLQIARNWLAGTVGAWIVAKILLWSLGSYVTGIVGGSSSSYTFTNSWHNVWPATVFAAKAILLNFGITARAGRIAMLPAAINFLTLACISWAAYWVARKLRATEQPNIATTLSAMLLVTTVAALAVYTFTDHPYSADARYLAISLFAGFVTLATYFRTVVIRPRILVAAEIVCLLAIVVGIGAVHTYDSRALAANQLERRNLQIVHALRKHPEELLVGNYWRVVPARALTPGAAQQIVPLRSCFVPIASLRSNLWLKDLRQHSFAYILSLGADGTPFAPCGLRQVTFMYGVPSSAVVVAGSARNPAELLLFYDNGADNRGAKN